MKMADIIALEQMIKDEKEKLWKKFADSVKIGDIVRTKLDKYALITFIGSRRLEYLPWDHDLNRFHMSAYAESAYRFAQHVSVEIIGHIDIAGEFAEIIKGADK